MADNALEREDDDAVDEMLGVTKDCGPLLESSPSVNKIGELHTEGSDNSASLA